MEKKLAYRWRAALAALLILLSSTALALDRVSVEVGNSPSLGLPDAPLRIIEFVDYQ